MEQDWGGWSEDIQAWKRVLTEEESMERSKEAYERKRKRKGFNQNKMSWPDICQKRVFPPNAMDYVLLDWHSSMAPALLFTKRWEKLFLRSIVKVAAVCPFISLSSCLICSPSIWNKDRQHTATQKSTHTALLTLIIVSRSGTACVGGRWGEMWPGVAPSVGDSVSSWTNVLVVVLVESTRISVSMSVVVFRNVPVISTFNLTFWLF